MTRPVVSVPNLKMRGEDVSPSHRIIPEETAVAIVYDASTHAVMMATPKDLEDFALGFSLTEGKIENAQDISSFEIVEQKNGIEVRMWLAPKAGQHAALRRRALFGPTGCGLCGLESLDQALPKPQFVAAQPRVSVVEIQAAVASMAPAQILNAETRAMHAAGFWTLDHGLMVLREDVGRHNALDKLFGALSREKIHPETGIVVLTSRISVELVQKAATMGVPILVAVSAPTALALKTAQEAGITLVGIARDDGFEIFTHSQRILYNPKDAHTTKKLEKFGAPLNALC